MQKKCLAMFLYFLNSLSPRAAHRLEVLIRWIWEDSIVLVWSLCISIWMLDTRSFLLLCRILGHVRQWFFCILLWEIKVLSFPGFILFFECTLCSLWIRSELPLCLINEHMQNTLTQINPWELRCVHLLALSPSSFLLCWMNHLRILKTYLHGLFWAL